jgi:hypothetical protein
MSVAPPAADFDHPRPTRGDLAEQDHILRHARDVTQRRLSDRSCTPGL